MADPVSISASVIALTSAAIGTVKFLYTTIGDIKGVPAALETLDRTSKQSNQSFRGCIQT